MPLRINPDVFPTGGWNFVDPDGVTHNGASLKHLVERVTDFRVRRGVPVGDPFQEVTNYLCSNNPMACKDGIRKAPKPVSALNAFSGQVALWMSRVYRGMLRLPDTRVSRQVAETRSAICARCPHQQSWQSSCGGCSNSILQVGIQIRNSQDVKNAAALRGCEMLAEDTRTSVWLDRLQPVHNPSLPENCWRKAK
jgi:hypothetical protein